MIGTTYICNSDPSSKHMLLVKRTPSEASMEDKIGQSN